jgi:hypothetical protein
MNTTASNGIIDSEEYAKHTRKESAIQAEILAWLAMQDWVFWRNNTGCATQFQSLIGAY